MQLNDGRRDSEKTMADRRPFHIDRRRVFYLDLASEAIDVVGRLDNWICFAIASAPCPPDEAKDAWAIRPELDTRRLTAV